MAMGSRLVLNIFLLVVPADSKPSFERDPILVLPVPMDASRLYFRKIFRNNMHILRFDQEKLR